MGPAKVLSSISLLQAHAKQCTSSDITKAPVGGPRKDLFHIPTAETMFAGAISSIFTLNYTAATREIPTTSYSSRAMSLVLKALTLLISTARKRKGLSFPKVLGMWLLPSQTPGKLTFNSVWHENKCL